MTAPDHVARPRLSATVGQARVVLLEAAGGAGKSAFLTEVIAAADGPALLAELPGPGAGWPQLRARLLADMIARGVRELAEGLRVIDEEDPVPELLELLEQAPEPLVLAIDDVHHAGPQLEDQLRRLAAGWPDAGRLLLAGRRLPDGLDDLGSPTGTLSGALSGSSVVSIDGDVLAFTPEEATDLLAAVPDLDPDDARALAEATDGWAAALVLTRRRLDNPENPSPGEVERLLRRPLTVASLVEDLLAGCSVDQRALLGRLAALPRFDDGLLRRIGLAEGLAWLRELGLPLREREDGWVTVPDSVTEALGAPVPDDELLAAATEHYRDRGRVDVALQVAMGAQDGEGLAKLLATLTPTEIADLDPAEYAEAVAGVDDEQLREQPAILLGLADVYALAGRGDRYVATLRRAEELVSARPEDDPVRLEVDAAVLSMRTAIWDVPVAPEDAERLLAEPALPALGRGRALTALGRARAATREPADLEAAGEHFAAAARLFQRLEAPGQAVSANLLQGIASAWPLGRHDEVLRAFDRALGTAGSRLRPRTLVLPFRAFVLIETGRYAEAEGALGELRRLARIAGDERSAAYARWGMARLASQRGDAAATLANVRAVEQTAGWVDSGGGAFFRADAAQLLARVGRLDEAERLLAEAFERAEDPVPLVTTGDLGVAAYRGDADRADAAMEELRQGAAVEPRDRWRVLLLQAYAHHLAGREDAPALAAAAFEGAAQLGYPQLPQVREPAAAAALLPEASAISPSAAELLHHVETPMRLRAFGRVELTHGGTSDELSGRPAELVVYLAVHGGVADVESTIEALWPDGDPERGRQRLRTILARVRREVGDVVDRVEDQLRFRRGLEVDVLDFDELAARAEDAEAPSRARSDAEAALALHRDGLATSLPETEWLQRPRELRRRQVVRLHDLLARIAEDDDRIDDAVRSLTSAIELEPTVEDRYVTAARLLALQQRRSRALLLLEQARSALAELDLAPSSDLVRLEAYLRRSASDVAS